MQEVREILYLIGCQGWDAFTLNAGMLPVQIRADDLAISVVKHYNRADEVGASRGAPRERSVTSSAVRCVHRMASFCCVGIDDLLIEGPRPESAPSAAASRPPSAGRLFRRQILRKIVRYR